jgi:hypothetical protein
VDTVIEAAPALSAAVPSVDDPSINVTLPVAVAGNTLAVKVTFCPTFAGFGDPIRLVVDDPNMVIGSDWVPVSLGLELSVTVTFKVLMPAAVGVPARTPDEAFRVRPWGAPVALHASGAVPLIAVSCWL